MRNPGTGWVISWAGARWLKLQKAGLLNHQRAASGHEGAVADERDGRAVRPAVVGEVRE